MPVESNLWTRDQRSSALFHELSHIKRNDFLIKILARISCALYWFNPLSWLTFSLIKKEQEKACDELVLKAGVKPSTYAANLLSIKKAGQFQWNPPAAVLSAVGKSQLNERLLAILKQQLKPKEVKMKTKVLLSFFIIASIAVIGMARCSQATAMNETNLPDNQATLTETQQPVQAAEHQETTEQEKKKETAEKEKKKEVKWVSKEGKTTTFDIYVDKDDKGTKKIILKGEPVIVVKKGDHKKGVIFNISGKDAVLIKSEDGKWTLKSDVLHLIKEDDAKVIKLDKGKISAIKVEKGKNGKNVLYISSPDVELKKIGKDDKAFTIHIDKDKGAKDIHIVTSPKIHIEKSKKYHTIHIEGEEGKAKKVYVTPHIKIDKAVALDAHPVFRLKIDNEELKKKLKLIQEKIEKIKEIKYKEAKIKAQEEALQKVEEILKEINAELLKYVNVNVRTDIKDKIRKAIKIDEKVKDRIKLRIAEKIGEDQKFISVDKDAKVISLIDKDDAFQMVIKSHLDSENKAKYMEIINKLKEELPEGYEVKSEIDEEKNTIMIKIKTDKKDEEATDKIKKLMKKVVEKIKQLKDKTAKKEITSV